MAWLWIMAAAAIALALVLWGQYRAQRGVYRPLSSRQPQRDPDDAKTPLGMEGLDLALIERTARQNEALERSTGGWNARRTRGSFLGAAPSQGPAKPEDETYAAWFHAAFLKDKSKDKTR